MIEPIFSTTQLAISISPHIPLIHVPTLPEHNTSFTIAPSYLVIQMLNDQYLTMNPTKNNTLLAYFGNYGQSYVGNDNIPNSWTMILNLYYLGNPPLTFSNTPRLATYLFPNMVSIRIITYGGS